MHAPLHAAKKGTASSRRTTVDDRRLQGGGGRWKGVRPRLLFQHHFCHFYPTPKLNTLCGLRVIGSRQSIDVLDDQIEGDQGADSAQQRPEKLP